MQALINNASAWGRRFKRCHNHKPFISIIYTCSVYWRHERIKCFLYLNLIINQKIVKSWKQQDVTLRKPRHSLINANATYKLNFTFIQIWLMSEPPKTVRYCRATCCNSTSADVHRAELWNVLVWVLCQKSSFAEIKSDLQQNYPANRCESVTQIWFKYLPVNIYFWVYFLRKLISY